MISKTAEYALRVSVILQRHFGQGSILGKDIATKAGVPASYVNTILHRLGHAGLVAGDRGPGGGYRLITPGRQIAVLDIVSVFDDVAAQRHCVLGHAICDGTDGCPVHDMWADVLSAYDRFLNEMTLERLASIQSISTPKRKQPARLKGISKRKKPTRTVRTFKV